MPSSRHCLLRSSASAAALGLVALALLPGCSPGERITKPKVANPPGTQPASPATAPTSAPATHPFTDKDSGVSFSYPADWTPKPDKDYVLRLAPTKGATDRSITFDVPDLPPHFPGMIQLGLIEGGYLDDLKKQHTDLKVEKSSPFPLGDDAKARLVETSWKNAGNRYEDSAVLIMRHDQVYIFACDSNAADHAATRVDLEAIMKSVKWPK